MRPSLARGCGVVGSDAETGSGFVARPIGGGARGRAPRGLAAGGRDIFTGFSMYFALSLSRAERFRDRLEESVLLLLLAELYQLSQQSEPVEPDINLKIWGRAAIKMFCF